MFERLLWLAKSTVSSLPFEVNCPHSKLFVVVFYRERKTHRVPCSLGEDVNEKQGPLRDPLGEVANLGTFGARRDFMV